MDNGKFIREMLSSNGFIPVNKYIASKIGFMESAYLGLLAYKYNYWEEHNSLKNGFFFITQEDIQKEIGLSPYQQRNSLKKLTGLGIVQTKRMDMPRKLYYTLNINNLTKIMEESTSLHDVKKLDNSDCSSEVSSQHDVKFFDNLCEVSSQHDVEFFDTTKNLSTNNLNTNKLNTNNKETIALNQLENEFETLWQLYPNKKGKEKAKKSYIKYRKAGTTYAEVEKGINAYVFFHKEKGTEPEFIKYGSTYFAGAIWNDDYTVIKKKSFFERIDEL